MAAAMDTQEIKKEQEGYQTAFKATALFGGVRVINILVSILKSKIVALWLGTTGFGIMSLFNSATSLIYSITNLGLQDSAVRDIAYAKGQNNLSSVARTVKVTLMPSGEALPLAGLTVSHAGIFVIFQLSVAVSVIVFEPPAFAKAI